MPEIRFQYCVYLSQVIPSLVATCDRNSYFSFRDMLDANKPKPIVTTTEQFPPLIMLKMLWIEP